MVNRIIIVYSTVTIRNKTTNETRYYISDLTKSAIDFSYIIRSHQAIENSLHYVKDVAFLEDFNRMRTKQIPQIASLIRSLAINILNVNKFTNMTKARKLLGWGSRCVFGLKSS